MIVFSMGNTANISFRDEDMDVWEWMEKQHNEGMFRNRSHVVVAALRRMKEQEGDDVLI